MKVYFILGTAAELIKMYPLVLGLKDKPVQWYVWNTGQSKDNFWTQYDDFAFPREKAFCLDKSATDLKARSGALKWFLRNYFSSRSSIRKQIQKITGSSPEAGDLALVHGDTLSTLLGSIVARRLGMQVIHVEAGMRSGHLFEPFPEEICRRWVSRLARIHFAPDSSAAEKLRIEHRKGIIETTSGNSVYDAVSLALKQPRPQGLPSGKYVVCNLHRFENLHSQDRWQLLIETSLKAAEKYPVYFVMHPPTKTRLEADPVSRQKLLKAGVQLWERLPYMRYIHLIAKSHFLITDSGSNQQESSYMGTPCLLLREHTESREGLGENCLLSRMNPAVIDTFLGNVEAYRRNPEPLSSSPSAQILKQLRQTTGLLNV